METTENVIKFYDTLVSLKFSTPLEEVLYYQDLVNRNYRKAGVEGISPELLAERYRLQILLDNAEITMIREYTGK